MKLSLKIEELFMLALGILGFNLLSFSWWLFAALILLPDIGMVGYIISPKVGAFTYNMFHHKGLAIFIYFLGVYLRNESVMLIGVILFSHASFDRILGYGLKYNKGFKFTHLGEIG